MARYDTLCGTYKDSVGKYIGVEYQIRTGVTLCNAYSALAWSKNNKINSIAVFDNYTGPNINIHIWAVNALTRNNINEAYSYVFKQLKCLRLTAIVAESNKTLMGLLDRLGFVYEYTMEDYTGTIEQPESVLVYKLTSDKARKWMR